MQSELTEMNRSSRGQIQTGVIKPRKEGWIWKRLGEEL